MPKKSVRIPQQKRSIEKKERIVEAAYRIFVKNGYFRTTTADIAKEAGLSVGSIYAYFTDKKDILLACMNQFGNQIYQQVYDEMQRIPETFDSYETVRKILQIVVTQHERQSLLYHNEVTSLQYIDPDVSAYFIHIQDRMARMTRDVLEAHGRSFPHPREQMFLIFRMMDSLQDELAFKLRPDLDHEALLDQAAHLIVSMIGQKTEGQ